MSNVLHIDTSDQNAILISLSMNSKKEKLSIKNKKGSQVILVTIENLLKKNKLSLKDLNEIIVNEGPGSFTGLRVGISVANALGHFLKIPVNGRLGQLVNAKYK